MLLDLVLSARGYNNSSNFIESGEEFFIKKYLSNKTIRLCIDVGAGEGKYTHLLLKETTSKVDHEAIRKFSKRMDKVFNPFMFLV